MHAHIRLTLLTAALTFATGCTGDREGRAAADGDGGAGGPGDSGGADGADDAPPRLLLFDTPAGIGDDGAPCTTQDRCSVAFSHPDQPRLGVLSTAGGDPVAGETVRFTVVADTDPDGIVRLSAGEAVTDAEGRAGVDAAARVPGEGIVTVLAEVDGLPARVFDLSLSVFNPAPLVVTATYAGTRAINAYDVLLYGTDAAPAGCGDPLALLNERAADAALTNILLGRDATFALDAFVGLEADGEQRYVIVARSLGPDGEVIALGCDDASGVVRWTTPTAVTVPLLDR